MNKEKSFLDEINKEDMALIKKFDEKIINRLDPSTFNLAMNIAGRIIKQIDAKMLVNDYEGKLVKFEFDDITFYK